jgi:hypothetical protein
MALFSMYHTVMSDLKMEKQQETMEMEKLRLARREALIMCSDRLSACIVANKNVSCHDCTIVHMECNEWARTLPFTHEK